MKTQLYLPTRTERADELRSSLVWPLILLVSAAVTAAATFSDALAPLRPYLVFWFMLVCPGMAYVRLFRIRDWMAEWVLAIGLSIAFDTLVSLALLYTHNWQPALGFIVLLAITLPGALWQFWSSILRSR